MSAFELSPGDLQRVCRDLAWSEVSAMAGFKTALPSRIDSANFHWSSDAPGALALDSLARMQLATAVATWCNAYDAGYEDLFLAKRSVADWAQVMLRARGSGAKHFTFSTSGSTGARKHIRHFEDVLASEARAWVSVLSSHSDAVAIKRVVVLCPTHHIYGFIWGVLLPMALGVPVLDADLSKLPALLPGDLLVAVPDQWTWLAQSQTKALGVQGISSTAPLPIDVHQQLVAPSTGKPFLTRLLQIYGSSETAGLAWRDDPLSAYQLAPGRSRSSGDGITLELPSGASVAMAVQDELDWVSGTAFELIRRSDSMVQVGGHNVSPEWVASKLQSHPAVKLAVVRLRSNGHVPRLKAFVVLYAAGQSKAQNEVEAWARSELPDHACPQIFAYGEQLPTNSMGKPSDWPET